MIFFFWVYKMSIIIGVAITNLRNPRNIGLNSDDIAFTTTNDPAQAKATKINSKGIARRHGMGEQISLRVINYWNTCFFEYIECDGTWCNDCGYYLYNNSF
jgi:hypothetical protein